MARDLINTPFEDIVEGYFRQFAKGNEGYADAQVLELDGTTLKYKVKIRHKHKIRGVTVYAMNTYAEGKVDLLHPDPGDVKLRIETPAGDIVITIEELIEALTGAGLV